MHARAVSREINGHLLRTVFTEQYTGRKDKSVIKIFFKPILNFFFVID